MCSYLFTRFHTFPYVFILFNTCSYLFMLFHIRSNFLERFFSNFLVLVHTCSYSFHTFQYFDFILFILFNTCSYLFSDFPHFYVVCRTVLYFSKLCPTCSYLFLELSRTFSYFFLLPLQLSRFSLPSLLSPTFSDLSEKVGEGREGREGRESWRGSRKQ